ncbi:MAG: ATP-binding protein, partial [bacterium]
LAMVLKNLVGNAVKFTERGSVRVAVEPIEGALRFVIADSGIGIEPSELPHLFEPFHQAHGARSRRAGGAGLGLYIVGRLVELLGGQIAVQSAPGSGTTFAVTLPLETAAQ